MVQKAVPVQTRAIGNVQAYSTVTVKVGGELTRAHLTEGQDVRKGELLFTIDPRPYEAALKSGRGQSPKGPGSGRNMLKGMHAVMNP